MLSEDDIDQLDELIGPLPLRTAIDSCGASMVVVDDGAQVRAQFMRGLAAGAGPRELDDLVQLLRALAEVARDQRRLGLASRLRLAQGLEMAAAALQRLVKRAGKN